jgi:hypothetical protein
MDYKSQTILALIIVSIVASFAIIFVAFGASPSDDPKEDEGIKVGDVNTIEQDASNKTEYVNSIENENGSYTITGRIKGSSGGGNVVLKSIEEDNNTVKLNMGIETSGIGTTVVTGYKYKMNVDNIDDNTSLIIMHNEDEFNAFKDSTEDITEEGLRKVNNTEDINLNIRQTGKTSEYEESARIADWSNNQIRVEGQIIAEQAGEKVVIKDYEVKDGVFKINIDTEAPQDGVYPQVIVSHNYELQINSSYNTADLKVVVNHTEGEEYSFNNIDTENNISQKVSASLESVSSYSSNPEESVRVQSKKDTVHITGTIIGNTGGQQVIVDNIENRDGRTYVNIDLNKPNKFVTQVITGYNYNISVSNAEDEIVVLHKGEKVYPTEQEELNRDVSDK